MLFSRRSFLEAGSKLGLAAVFSGSINSIAVGQIHRQNPLEDAGPFAPGQRGDTLARITRNMFADNLETEFSFSLDGVKLADMTLIEVNDLTPAGPVGKSTAGGECFSIVFLGPRSLPLRQDTYTIKHHGLGKFRILVVPGVAGKGGRLRYGALINRTHPEVSG